ncbi:MAG: hypothetical protein H7X70_02460 [Candidatus Kapabacteria bacterium]|nr:hypothetical protein [Candidatus Kapabacteria bacterium]
MDIRTAIMRGLYAAVIGMMVFIQANAQQQQPDRRPLLKVGLEIVDVAQQPSGRMWVTTRTFDVYTAMPGDRSWRHELLHYENLVAKLEVKRVARLFFLTDSIGVLAGDILTYETGSPLSCILRTTNGGTSWHTSVVSTDTLAVTDAVRMTNDGMIFMLDQVGRFWTSRDKGASWVQGKLPLTLQGGDFKEMDMTSTKMGVAIDRFRTISFTTNSWQSVIPARPSSKPIVRTQPNMHDQLAWARDLVMWNDRLILTEGRDIYTTLLNDLLWERWDDVVKVCMSDDRAYLYYVDRIGQLWKWKSGEAAAVKIASDLLVPRTMRAAHGSVILYRPDTGPIVVNNSGATTMRMYADQGEISEPRRIIRDKDTEWGMDWLEPNDLSIDLYRRQLPKGLWQRDTFAYVGKTLFRAVGDDSLIVGEGSLSSLYDGKARQFRRYVLSKPIDAFLKAPITGFRIVVERSTGKSTRRSWCDYRLKNGQYQCGEVVDSSDQGVRSAQFLKSYTRDEIFAHLSGLNNDANVYPSVSSISFTEKDIANYRSMLDTIFQYDGYFDTLDLYRPPPATDVQIASCISTFANVANEIPTLTNDRLGQALLSFRHWPSDRDVRYISEFTNSAGDILMVEMDRSNEVHLPMLMPWRVTFRGQAWHWYGRTMAPFFIASISPMYLPEIFTRMMEPQWLLLSIASSLDAERNGRYHRWYQRPWKNN